MDILCHWGNLFCVYYFHSFFYFYFCLVLTMYVGVEVWVGFYIYLFKIKVICMHVYREFVQCLLQYWQYIHPALWRLYYLRCCSSFSLPTNPPSHVCLLCNSVLSPVTAWPNPAACTLLPSCPIVREGWGNPCTRIWGPLNPHDLWCPHPSSPCPTLTQQRSLQVKDRTRFPAPVRHKI